MLRVAGVLIGGLVAFALYREVGGRLFGTGEIEWQGETFRLRRKFLDYEQFKKSIDPLHADERARAKAVMLALPAPKWSASWARLVSAVPESFPGYGSSSNGGVRDTEGGSYALFEYEIPGSGTNRSLLYRGAADGSWTLVFDGISPDPIEDHELGGERRIVVADGMLRSYRDGKLYREVALTDTSAK